MCFAVSTLNRGGLAAEFASTILYDDSVNVPLEKPNSYRPELGD